MVVEEFFLILSAWGGGARWCIVVRSGVAAAEVNAGVLIGSSKKRVAARSS